MKKSENCKNCGGSLDPMRRANGSHPFCPSCLKEHNKKYYQDHKDEMIERSRKWRQEHPEQLKETIQLYNQSHKEEHKEYYKKYSQDHRQQARLRARKYQHENKDYCREKQKEYLKTPKGKQKIARRNNRRQRELGFKPINAWFDGSHGHHLDKINVVYVPVEIHMSIRHGQNYNESMTKINMKAWDYLESSVL